MEKFEYTSEYAKMKHNPTEKDVQCVMIGDKKFVPEAECQRRVREARVEERKIYRRVIGEAKWMSEGVGDRVAEAEIAFTHLVEFADARIAEQGDKE